jgi:hypothetical protein
VSRHRAQPPPRYQPRWGRFVVLGVSLTTTAVALLGGVGVLPSAADEDHQPESLVAADVDNPVAETSESTTQSTVEPTEEATIEPEGRRDRPRSGRDDEPTKDLALQTDPEPTVVEAPLPPDSGEGKRVVFSESEQRVWLVGSADKVRRTYLVSGSLTDNLQPGTYEVYSRSEDAIGIDDSGTMEWFVRFTQGPTGAAIGFHTIPVDDGERVQTVADLGTPQSHGCIRQATPDALALWDFAPLGTTVVVV